jgi:hypothetical protein
MKPLESDHAWYRLDIDPCDKSLPSSRFSRGAAAVNSQGRKPLEFPITSQAALKGRNETVPPFRG